MMMRAQVVAVAFVAALAAVGNVNAAYTPPRFPIETEDIPVIDGKTACEDLKTSIPALLANARSSRYTMPMKIDHAIAMFYENGENPTTKQLYAGIPAPVLAPARESLSAIIKSAGDWTRAQIRGDMMYGLEDETQSEKGGLPPFCRFAANIITSNSSETWFEVWLPLPESVPANSTSTTDSAGPTASPAGMPDIVFEPRAGHKSHHTKLHHKPKMSTSKSASGSKSSAIARGTHSNSASTKFHTHVLATTSSKAAKAANATTTFSTTPTSSETVGRAPSDNWHGRLVYVGSGGQRGSISYPDMKQIITRYRQATASSNLGHFGSGSGTNWTIGDYGAQIDFAYRGTHAASLASQAVVKQFYGVKGRGSITAKGKGAQSSSLHKRTRKLSDGKTPFFGFPAYYAGCSTGGRQGMAEANRFPYDFNGILAGSPAVYYNQLNAYQIHVNSYQNDSSSAQYIPQELYPVIHDFILQECDEIDGIKDAVLEDPTRCKPRLENLLCAPNVTSTTIASSTATSSAATSSTATSSTATPSTSTMATNSASTRSSSITYAPAGKCLTPAQLTNLRNIYKPYRYPNGRLIHEPVEYGSETVWNVTDGVVGKPFPPAPGWYQYQVLNRTDPTSDFDYYNEVTFGVIRQGEEQNPAGTNTNNASVSDFFARGGKLIHYHGLADQLIPSGASKRFYRAIQSDFDRSDVGGPMSDFYRFFPIPGMGHCRGGDGAWNFGAVSQTITGARPYKNDTLHDVLLALFAWTEDGLAPAHLDGAAYNIPELGASESKDYVTSSSDTQIYNRTGGLKFTHRFCPYPQQAVLTDRSNPYSASSQRCRTI